MDKLINLLLNSDQQDKHFFFPFVGFRKAFLQDYIPSLSDHKT